MPTRDQAETLRLYTLTSGGPLREAMRPQPKAPPLPFPWAEKDRQLFNELWPDLAKPVDRASVSFRLWVGLMLPWFCPSWAWPPPAFVAQGVGPGTGKKAWVAAAVEVDLLDLDHPVHSWRTECPA